MLLCPEVRQNKICRASGYFKHFNKEDILCIFLLWQKRPGVLRKTREA